MYSHFLKSEKTIYTTIGIVVDGLRGCGKESEINKFALLINMYILNEQNTWL